MSAANAAAELALAKVSIAHVEGRLTSGLCAPKRRASAHVTIRALRLYAALLRLGCDLDALTAAIDREGNGCSRPASQDPASFVNDIFHSPETDGKAVEADENPMCARTNFLQGREDDVRRHR